jgi:acetyl-CoA acetyltransferase
MMRKVCVAGVGMTPFGKFRERSFQDLGREAVWNAIKDANIEPKRIQVAYAGHARTGQTLGWECGVGQAILSEVGINKIPVTSVGNFCSSGSVAVREAWMAVASGFYDVAIAIGVEKLSVRKGKGQPLTSDGVELEGPLGFTPPAFFAMVAQSHMEKYGTTREQLASIAVKNRSNSVHNPRSQYREAISIEQVINAKPVADPFGIYDCCPTGDGASAAIFCNEEIASQLGKKKVYMVGSSLVSGSYDTRDMTSFDSNLRAVEEVYKMAGLGPADVDVIELHDCFTSAELVHTEDLGFCPKGEGGSFIAEGNTQINGKVAINPSGGLLSKGHPLGATGVAQVAEVVWQLRGEAGQRQVADAKVGMTHTAGGFKDGDTASMTINLFTT